MIRVYEQPFKISADLLSDESACNQAKELRTTRDKRVVEARGGAVIGSAIFVGNRESEGMFDAISLIVGEFDK